MQYRTTRNGLTVHIANTKDEYEADAKRFVLNMYQNRKKLHIKNSCYQSRYLFEYVSFDTEQEVNELPFSKTRCEICFPR